MTRYFVPIYVNQGDRTRPGSALDAIKGDGQGRGIGYGSSLDPGWSDGWGDGLGYGVGDGNGYRCTGSPLILRERAFL